MMVRLRSFAGAVFLCPTMLFAGVAVPPGPAYGQGVIGQTPSPRSERLDQLEQESGAIRDRIEELGGSRSANEAISKTRGRIYEIREQADRLEDSMLDTGTSDADLKAMRDQAEGTPVITDEEFAEEVGEEVAQKALERVLPRFVSAPLAIILTGADVVEYGGKLVIRELEVRAIDQMIEEQKSNAKEVNQLFNVVLTGLYRGWTSEQKKLTELEQLKVRDSMVFGAIAEERRRLAEAQRTARSRANVIRDQDPAGDDEVLEQYLDDSVRFSDPNERPRVRTGVRLANPPAAPSSGGPISDARGPCGVYGAGFFYIPGTDTCMQVGSNIGYPAGGDGAEDGLIAFLSPLYVYRDANVTVGRLARDAGGMIFYDVSLEEQEDSGAGGEFGLAFPLRMFGYEPKIELKLSYLDIDGGGSGSSPDGTADFLLFPGLGVEGTNPGGNPAGYARDRSAGSNAHDYSYEYRYRQFGAETSVGVDIERGDFEFYPWVGLRLASGELDDEFVADVPLYLTGAIYATETDIWSVGPFVGLSVQYGFPAAPFSLFAQGRLGLDVTHAESDVLFEFDVEGAFNDVQEISISDDALSPWIYGEIGVGMDYGGMFGTAPGAFTGSLKLFAEHGGYAPEIQIPGGAERPELDGEAATNLGFKYTMSVRIGP